MDKAVDCGLIDDAAGKDVLVWDKPVTRLEMARIVHTAVRVLLNEPDEASVATGEPLTDLSGCAVCLPHIEQLYAKGIIAGRPDRTFGGSELLTRAEACAVAVRMEDKSRRVVPEQEGKADYVKITPQEAKALRESRADVVFVDVRTPEEYAAGHIASSLNLPYGTMTEESCRAALPRRDAPIVLYCASGIRSAKAAALLAGWGYTGVYDMGGVSGYPDPLVKNQT